MIALAKAGQVLEEHSCLEAAIRIHDYIARKMVTENGRPNLRYRDGETAYKGQLEDYAVYALALLELYQVTFDAKYLQCALHWAKQMVELFVDTEKGGYYMTAFDSEQLIARPKETYDGAIPSGNSVAAVVLQTLASLTGELEWQAAFFPCWGDWGISIRKLLGRAGYYGRPVLIAAQNRKGVMLHP